MPAESIGYRMALHLGHTTEDGKTPSRPPELPDEITGLWIIARCEFPLRAAYFLPDRGWNQITITQDDYIACWNAPS